MNLWILLNWVHQFVSHKECSDFTRRSPRKKWIKIRSEQAQIRSRYAGRPSISALYCRSLYRIFFVGSSCSPLFCDHPVSERDRSYQDGKTIRLDDDLITQFLDPPPSPAMLRKLLWRSPSCGSYFSSRLECLKISGSGTSCSLEMARRPILSL